MAGVLGAPLHSICIAVVSSLTGAGDLLVTAGIVSSVMFVCLIVAVYYLSLELFDLRSALVASFFCALSPHLICIAFSPEAEITYTFFLMLSLFFAAWNVGRESVAGAAVTGISFALAWLARSEAVIVMACMFACMLAVRGRGVFRTKLFRNCLVSVLFFVMTAAPYLLFLKKQYGVWVLSPKSTYVQIWMKGRTYHDNNKDELHNDELWGLTPDGTRLRWQEPKGLSDLAGFLLSHPGKSLGVYLHDLGMQLPGRIPNNSGMERYPQLYPVYLVLAALAAAFLPWGERPGEKRAVLLGPLLILLVLPVFTEGWWKYLVPYLPVILILAARGCAAVTKALAANMSIRHADGLSKALLGAVAVIIGTRFMVALHPLPLGGSVPAAAPSATLQSRRGMVEEVRKAGEWGASRFGRGKNYMVRWNKIVYYLDGLWTAFPVADPPQIVDYARRNGVDYLVVEQNVAPSQSALQYPPSGLEVAGLYRSVEFPYVVVFYRVLY